MMGTKRDGGKSEFHLVPTEVMRAVRGVFRYGADKYAENNWRGGMPYTRMLNAAVRHLESFLEGEDIDPESGHHHLAHAITDLMMLFWWVLVGRGADDRWKGEVPVVEETNPAFMKIGDPNSQCSACGYWLDTIPSGQCPWKDCPQNDDGA